MADPISAAISGALAVGQTIAGAAKMAQANNITIDETDSRQVSFLDEILARSRAYDTGAAFTNARDSLSRDVASINAGVVATSGGQGGAAANNLARVAESSAAGFNNVMATGQQMQMQYTGLANQLINDIAQRRLEVRMAEKMQKRAMGTQLLQDGMNNMMGSAYLLSDKDPAGEKEDDKSGIMQMLAKLGSSGVMPTGR